MMLRLVLPSGVEVSSASLYRKVKGLTQKDIQAIESEPTLKTLRPKLREILGQQLARLYRDRRREKLGRDLDWWKLHGGKYQSIFSEAAIRARVNGLDPEDLIFVSERLARAKGLRYPTPQLVCGTWAFAEVANLPSEASICPVNQPLPDIKPEDHGEATWIWQPGYHWDSAKGEFVR
jgi:hypothetical protein